MKAVIVSDIHLGVHKSDKIWIKQTETLFDEIYNTCQKENIKTIIIAGDFFDERLSVDVSTLCKGYEILNKLNELEVIMVLGNHDVYYKNLLYPNSLTLFESLPHIRLITEPTIIDNIQFIPWSVTKYDMTEFKSPVLIGHLDINDFYLTGKADKHSYKIDEFKHFDLVVSGHFHIPSIKENIMYCGAPFHLTFNDRDSKNGYYILDDTKTKFIENGQYAKYTRISSEDDLQQGLIEGNIVRLIYDKDYGSEGNNKKLEDIQKLKPLRVTTDFSKISTELTDDTQEGKLTESIVAKDIFMEYIDTVTLPTHIKKNVLLKSIEIIMGR